MEDSGESDIVYEAGRVSARVGTTRGDGLGLEFRVDDGGCDKEGAEDGGAGGGLLVLIVVTIGLECSSISFCRVNWGSNEREACRA